MKIEKVIPKDDRVLVDLSIESEKMYGSIIVADMGQEKPQIGIVLDVGPGRVTEFGQKIKCTVKVGDKVLIPKIGYFKVPSNTTDQDLILIQDKEILAILEEKDEESN